MLSLGVGIAVTVAVVVCVAVLVLAILFGLRRYGASGRLQSGSSTCEEKQEMEWDNSSLNVTVNPLDTGRGCDVEMEEMHIFTVMTSCTAEDARYSGVNQLDDASEDEVDKDMTHCGTDVKELEWDDSTLSY